MKLNIDGISKRYGNGTYGLKDFSMTLENGILGLLGPNGAGKSTLLKMIATVSKPTKGLICLNKNNIVKDPNYMRQQLGFLPQNFGVYPNLNAIEFLKYIAAIKGVGGINVNKRINQLLDGLNLMESANKPIGSYSGGMKQRVGIAQVLLNNPKVVLFDEPTVGLDPEERVRFRNLISDLANNSIIVLSSHIVSDIDTMADRVAIVKNGSLISQGNPEDLITLIKGKVFEKIMDKHELKDFKLKYTVVSATRKNRQWVVRYVSERPTTNSVYKEANLEDAYLYFTKTN